MAFYLQQLQHAFPGLQATLQNATNNSMVAAPSNETIPQLFENIAGQVLPPELSSILSLLFSMTSLRDWLKLLVIGGFFESCRRLFSWMYSSIMESFYMHATFDSDDPSYEWMMVWLSQQPAWSKTRDVEISTQTYGSNNAAVTLGDDDESGLSKFDYKTTRKLSYIPSPSKTYTLWYKRRYMTITRTREKDGRYNEVENILHVNILTRDHKLLLQLLQEARTSYISAQENKLSIWTADTYNDWRRVASRPKRSLSSIVLDPGIKDTLLDDARDFLASKEWYNERGIPFRRGYLLYGAPGSGKTSVIHSIAGELELDIYIISISRIGLDDASLSSLVNYLPERCVALMEDIDAAFTNGLTRDLEEDLDEIAAAKKKGEVEEPAKDNDKGNNNAPSTGSRVTLSGLLNALDGIGAQEGRILFATTNNYSSLDPALCRPGRMDLHIEFKLASTYQAKWLFRQFYHPAGVFDQSSMNDSEEEEDEKQETDSDDSGYNSSSESPTASPTLSVLSARSSSSSRSFPEPVLKAYSKTSKSLAEKHTVKEIKALSIEFAKAIPERELSMASLQGYLMMYKTRPVDAVKNVVAWVQKEKEAALQRQKKKNKGKKSMVKVDGEEKQKDGGA